MRIIEKWNALPIEIKSLGKIQHFKKGTKRLSRIMVEGCTRPVCGSDQDDQPPRAATDVSTMLPGAAKEPTIQVLFCVTMTRVPSSSHYYYQVNLKLLTRNKNKGGACGRRRGEYR